MMIRHRLVSHRWCIVTADDLSTNDRQGLSMLSLSIIMMDGLGCFVMWVVGLAFCLDMLNILCQIHRVEPTNLPSWTYRSTMTLCHFLAVRGMP